MSACALSPASQSGWRDLLKRAVCWGAAARSRELLTQPLIDAVATLSIDHWNGKPRLDVELKDFRLAEERSF